MIMTEARPEVTIMRTAVRCSAILKRDMSSKKRKGDTCSGLLALVADDRWEATMTDAVAGFCDRCGEPYNLGQYK